MFFCRTCDAIQAPPSKPDVFAVFGCAETFDVDVGDIARRFKQLQVKLHPDKWASRTPGELAIAEKTSALLNTSYQTLKSPAKRAEYLLARRGIDLNDASSSAALGADFLMEMMELREDIEQAKLADDAATLAALRSRVQRQMKLDSDALSSALRRARDEEARVATLRLRYWQRAVDTLDGTPETDFGA
jgi:molecular chaperone HscB